MPYSIEVLCVGTDLYSQLNPVIESLNSVQAEFNFSVPPERLLEFGIPYRRREYSSEQVFDFLEDYRKHAKGNRPFLVAFVNSPIRSVRLGNLFGSHRAVCGLAVVTIDDVSNFTDQVSSYICYYLIRYALSFVAPDIMTHENAANCFFDKKINKRDILLSMESGEICDNCSSKLISHMNPEIHNAFAAMKLLLIQQTESDSADSTPEDQTVHAAELETESSNGEQTRQSNGGGAPQLGAWELLQQAIRAVPAVRYALGVAGIGAALALIAGLRIDLRIAGFGIPIMLVLMIVLLLFAYLSTATSALRTPAIIFMWFSVCITMATVFLLFTSFFFGSPIDFKAMLTAATGT